MAGLWLQTSIRRHRCDGAPKWEFRVVSLNKWSASKGHYKSQAPHTPEFAGRFISLVVLQYTTLLRRQRGILRFCATLPNDARVLVGHGDNGTVHAAALTD